MKTDISPSRQWYLLALLITFLGPIIGFVSIIHILNTPAKVNIPLKQIGRYEIEIPKSGEYTLWVKPPSKMEHSYKIAYELGDNIKETPDQPYTFIHKKTKKLAEVKHTAPFPLVNWFKIQYSEVHIPIANVTFPNKGTYIANASTVEVPLSVSLGSPSIRSIYRSILINVILIFFTIIIGPLLAISILIARNSKRKTDVELEITDIRSENNIIAALCHASGFSLFLYPMGHIISPLFIWLFFKDQYPNVDQHGKSVLNFQISMSLYYIVFAVLIFFVIGIPLLLLLIMYHIIAMFVGMIIAAQGKPFRYPFSIPFIV